MFMNMQDKDVLNSLFTEGFANQRSLAQRCGHSLGAVNRSLRNLLSEGYIDADMSPTERARREIARNAPRRAVILAAGYGLRMIPINMETPKALIEVKGEVLIERAIRQLQEAGIKEIYVVVGFMKERHEYLIDRFGVKLVVNADYPSKNNLHSLRAVADRLDNAYIVPCDIWCEENPYRASELYSWYMVSEQMSRESTVRLGRKKELLPVGEAEEGNAMIGIAYLTADDARALRERMARLCADARYDGAFWEEALFGGKGAGPKVAARKVPSDKVCEINTYEQLRELDSRSKNLNADAIRLICAALSARPEEIRTISALKKGMTNRSFLFECRGRRYIMRIPGEGTDMLIDREQEAEVYRRIAGKGFCDDPVWLDPATGCKITEFIEGVRTCDPECEADLRACMAKLRSLHQAELKVGHSFDLFGQIDFYEKLRGEFPSAYADYAQTKAQVFSLRDFIAQTAEDFVLTHIDAVQDNFLFYPRAEGGEGLQLTDWEYSGMQDPHVDLAMFAIYAFYEREQIDRLIDLYFEGRCPERTRSKIYGYVAVCGLLWSNWCDYKRTLGVEFGEYSLRQYRYAKDYYRLVMQRRAGAEARADV